MTLSTFIQEVRRQEKEAKEIREEADRRKASECFPALVKTIEEKFPLFYGHCKDQIVGCTLVKTKEADAKRIGRTCLDSPALIIEDPDSNRQFLLYIYKSPTENDIVISAYYGEFVSIMNETTVCSGFGRANDTDLAKMFIKLKTLLQ